MADQQYSDLTAKSLTATTKFFCEDPDNANDFAYILGSQITQIGSNYFNATVGTTGDYADIQDAIDAGKYRIKLVTNVTSTQSVTVGANRVIIDLAGFTLNHADKIFNIPTGYLEVCNGIINFANPVGTSLFRRDIVTDSTKTLYVHDIVATNSSTATGNCFATNTGHFENIILNLPNYQNTGFYYNATSIGSKFYAKNILINGGGTSCFNVINLGGFANSSDFANCVLENIEVKGTVSSTSTNYTIQLSYGKITNVKCTSIYINRGLADNITSTNLFAGGNTDLVKISTFATSNLYFVASSVVKCFADKGIIFENFAITGTYRTNDVKIENCVFEKDVDLGAYFDNSKFLNNEVQGSLDSGTSTTVSEVSHNTITGNFTADNSYMKAIGNIIGGTLANTGDYNTFRDCDADIITNSAGASYCVFDNCTYTTSYTESSATTRKLDLYIN